MKTRYLDEQTFVGSVRVATLWSTLDSNVKMRSYDDGVSDNAAYTIKQHMLHGTNLLRTSLLILQK